MSITLMSEVWRLDLPTTDKMVLLALADAANDDGVTWMALESKEGIKLDLLKKTSLSRRAVQGAIARLCEAGYLTRVDRPGKGVVWTVKGCTSCAPQQMRPAADAPGGAAGAPKPSTNHQLTSEAKASSVTSRETAEDRAFKAFYAAYPVRKAPDAARKAFAKAMNRITEDDPLAVILAGVERALPGWDLVTKKFIPHPATWLNAGSWADEAPIPTRQTNDRSSAKLDHLNGIARAMEAACQPDEHDGRDRWEPGDGGGMRALPHAA